MVNLLGLSFLSFKIPKVPSISDSGPMLVCWPVLHTFIRAVQQKDWILGYTFDIVMQRSQKWLRRTIYETKSTIIKIGLGKRFRFLFPINFSGQILNFETGCNCFEKLVAILHWQYIIELFLHRSSVRCFQFSFLFLSLIICPLFKTLNRKLTALPWWKCAPHMLRYFQQCLELFLLGFLGIVTVCLV